MTLITEELRDLYLRNTIDLGRFSNHLELEMNKILTKVQKKVLGEMVAGNLTDWKLTRLKRINAKVYDILNKNFDLMGTELNRELQGLARNQLNFAVNGMNNIVGINLFDVNYSSELLETLGKKTWIQGGVLGNWLKRSQNNLDFNIQNMMGGIQQKVEVGMLTGSAIDTIVRDIRGTPKFPA